jgi:hypothetical protein
MATLIPERAPLVKRLSLLVVHAIAQWGVTRDDVFTGGIKYMDLMWQIPPLVSEDKLFGQTFSEHVQATTYVNADALAAFWADAMYDLRNRPHRVCAEDGYRLSTNAFPHMRKDERALHLSMPEGFPDSISNNAAVTFCLECAHILNGNTKLDGFVNDEDNYYAILPTGTEVGIKDGLPAHGSEVWDLPVHGMVQDLITSPRGEMFEGCDYSIISKVRSLLWDHQRMRDWQGVDWALQALRVMGGEKVLQEDVSRIKTVVSTRNARLATLTDAVEVVNRVALTDRQRVEILKHLLVPEVMSSATFNRTIYPLYRTPPPMMPEKSLVRMRQAVQDLYDAEVSMHGSHPWK